MQKTHLYHSLESQNSVKNVFLLWSGFYCGGLNKTGWAFIEQMDKCGGRQTDVYRFFT